MTPTAWLAVALVCMLVAYAAPEGYEALGWIALGAGLALGCRGLVEWESE